MQIIRKIFLYAHLFGSISTLIVVHDLLIDADANGGRTITRGLYKQRGCNSPDTWLFGLFHPSTRITEEPIEKENESDF